MNPDTPPSRANRITAASPPRDVVTELFAAALDGDPHARGDLVRLAGRDTLAARALAVLPAAEPAVTGPAVTGPAVTGTAVTGTAATATLGGAAPWAVAYVDQLFARATDPHRP
ncbi:hypothetical protein [Actinomycetospora termitidis]|uniref:Uncharacterized protein n=1 Tax=Actinomycetospora termitidis TaxID=3053470 RepID=A0ABT7MIC0_9PSEU|nr:hypothetical protein [Actinomycetospora sp. Odt1-22]MDL5160410.1 hypothetical protein [Actinomycetospora sp. Odt1-22]